MRTIIQSCSGLLVLVSALSAPGADSGSAKAEAALNSLRVSISPFPYDLTPEAAEAVGRITREYGNLYTVQLDNGIPWDAAWQEMPFNQEVMGQWERHKKAAGLNPVYLAIAPLAEDRIRWARSPAGYETPVWAKEDKRVTPQLKAAYSRYVLRAIDYFKPIYLNLGVEAGDMAAKKPAQWPQFEELFFDCAAKVREAHPSVKLGISFGLPLLMEKDVLERAGSVIDRSDYVGISFYPYLSDFYAKLGAAPLPAPPNQWRAPLDWLRRSVRKPVAICETGYSAEPVALPKYGLKMEGNPDLQKEYVSDLAAIARRDKSLFTVFFLCVDCDALMSKLPGADASGALWTHSGFFDKDLNARPAWAVYQRAWLGRSDAAAFPANATPVRAELPDTLGFRTRADLFTAPAPDEMTLEQGDGGRALMRWKYKFSPHKFSWAVKNIPAGAAARSAGLAFDLKSDRPEPVLLQVEQTDGAAFFCVLRPTREWSKTELRWSSFQPDPKKARSEKLAQTQIVRIMLADASAVDQNVSGGRTLEISNLRYLAEK